ncbi:hypothetical protein PAMP_015990 [Pampus punctatissimus]
MSELKHCVRLPHNQGERGGRRRGRVTLLGSRNPLRRRMSGTGEVVCEGWLRKSPPEKKLRRY